jgi:ParB/RepB/Spo0J family partition protein
MESLLSSSGKSKTTRKGRAANATAIQQTNEEPAAVRNADGSQVTVDPSHTEARSPGVAAAVTKGSKRTAHNRGTCQHLMLPAARIEPNDWNANEMSSEDYNGLVAEIKHLGRLPKPIVVRQNGERYTVVDGEHSLRAAKDLGMAEVWCELIEVNDFEAMRQSCARNLHGENNPIRLGQLYRRMMKMRRMSMRAFAPVICKSAGTVKNYLDFVEAFELRNDCAPEGAEENIRHLTIEQIRTYIKLPAKARDTWLAAGANPDSIPEATKRRAATPIPATVNGDQLPSADGHSGNDEPSEASSSTRPSHQQDGPQSGGQQTAQDAASPPNDTAADSDGTDVYQRLMEHLSTAETAFAGAAKSIKKDIRLLSVQNKAQVGAKLTQIETAAAKLRALFDKVTAKAA